MGNRSRWESPIEMFLQKQFRCRFGTVGMNKPTIQTKVETKTWLLSSVFLTIFNGKRIFKHHFFPKLSVNRTIYRCFAWKNWDLSSCFFDAKKRWVSERQAFYRKIRSLVGKPFFSIRKSKYPEKLKIFFMKDGRQRVSIPVHVGYMAALLLHFSFLQATSSSARLCISWAYQEMKKTLRLLSRKFLFSKLFYTEENTTSRKTFGDVDLRQKFMSVFLKNIMNFYHYYAITAVTQGQESTNDFLFEYTRTSRVFLIDF